MRTLLRCAVVAALFLTSFDTFSQASGVGYRTAQQDYVPGQVLVRFRAGKSASAKSAAHMRVQGVVRRQYKLVPDLQLVELPKEVSVQKAVVEYRSDPNVLYAEPNYIRRVTQSPSAPNDPMFADLWGMHNTGANGGTSGADIKAPEAWAISTGDKKVVVAVIDTGIDYKHPDLSANIWTNTLDCNTNGIDDDGDGYIDDCHGIDTVNLDSDPMDDHGHGTHVAGTIGAIGNNGVGVVGVNWAVTIIPCKFLDAGGFGSDEGAIACLDWLATLKQRGVNIVATSNSWGGGGYGQALKDAIQRHRDLGILFIAAAGNAASDNDAGDFYPSNYGLANIISVAATTRTDALAVFSDYGRHTVHIGAPGEDIQSTLPDNQYGSKSGTSMATPHVTGTVALLAAAYPELDWKQLKNRIISSGDVIPSLQSTITGRRLNAYSALTCSNSEVLSFLTPYKALLLGSVGKPFRVTALHINCEAPAGPVNATVAGTTITLQDDGGDLDEIAGDGVYSGEWIPTAPGAYTIALGTESHAVLVDPYTPSSPTMEWRDISSSGTGLALSGGFLGVPAFLQLPLPLSLTGRGVDSVTISPDGLIAVPTTWFLPASTSELPLAQTDIVLAPFNDSLYADGAVNTRNVFWAVLGDAPNRELVIEWRDVPHSDCSSPSDGGVTFQVVLFENKTDVLYNYKDVVFGGACAAHDKGATASVGIQPGTDSAVQYSFKNAGLADNMAILWKLMPEFPENPVPTLASINPPWFVASTYFTGLSLDAQGSNFTKSSVVLVDGHPRPAYYVSPAESFISFLQADFAQPRTVKVAMFNALPGGGKSQAVDYEFKQQDFALQLTSSTVDLTGTTSGTTTVTLNPAPAVVDPVKFTCSTTDPRLTCELSLTDTYGSFTAPVHSLLTIHRSGSASTSASLREAPPPTRRQAPWGMMFAASLAFAGGCVHVRGSRKRLAAMLVIVFAIAATQFACGGGGGDHTPPATSASMFANPTSIVTGQTSTLSWSTGNATTVTLDGAAVAKFGTKSVSPATTTTYHLVAQGAGGNKEATATVTVIQATTATVTVTVTAAGIERTTTVTVLMPS